MPEWIEKTRRDALRARRQMIRNGEALNAEEFCLRRGVSLKQLARLTASGSVFSIEIDGTGYYPALLVDPAHDRRRLAKLCRVLYPAPPLSRLNFLMSRWAPLGDSTPLEALRTREGRRLLREFALGWAEEFSRTIVRIYVGAFRGKDEALLLVCTAVANIDPRVRWLERTACAVQDDANIRLEGPYPQARAVTVVVSRHMMGESHEVPEARLDVDITNGVAHCRVTIDDYPSYDLRPVKVGKKADIVAVIRKILPSDGGGDDELTSGAAAML
ncbi:hypothetical protein [Burkholderia sp. PR2]|uniref:hypothetical protein n=1 Tax=Burkholderia sp. PR2 TaxID=3448078 RepID=UPI00402A610F